MNHRLISLGAPIEINGPPTPNRATAKRFAEYARRTVDALGDLAKDWITLNEPWCSAFNGYYEGTHAPGRRDLRDGVAAAHHLNLAHGLAVRAIREGAHPDVRIGLTNLVTEAVPATDRHEDMQAAERVDANNNLIRDDVELAIFDRYPDDPVIRSAMLQYAMWLQLELTQVFNSETWVAAVQQPARGSGRIFYALAFLSPIQPSEMSDEEFNEFFRGVDREQAGAKELALNNDTRTQKRDEVYESYATSVGSAKGNDCDIDLSTLNTNVE